VRTTLAAIIAASVPLAAGLVVSATSKARVTAQAARPELGQLEPGEDLPGGAATSRARTSDRSAFSQVSHGLDLEGETRFKLGHAIFRRLWVAAPSSTQSADGLGPLYNARSCQICHPKGGRGHPPKANWPEDDASSMVLRLSIPPETDEQKRLLAEHRANVIPDAHYGSQLQNIAVPGLDGEGHLHIEYHEVPVSLGDGTAVSIRAPIYSIADLRYGPLQAKVMLSPRVAPQMIGLGLLEAIPEALIRAGADPDDADGDGISGRTNVVWHADEGRVALGRFGWKAGAPSVRQQSAEAARGDIGLSSPAAPYPAGDCTEAQRTCLAAPNGNSTRSGGFELGEDLLQLVTFYAQNLAVPARRQPDSANVLEGKSQFNRAGCAGCHKPSFMTAEVNGQPHLSGQRIWPYSDLLLHDMGEGLADGRPEGVADGREWRTAPLWGIGLTDVVTGNATFLHDGRARSIEEAVLWHGGEAQAARDAYAALSKVEREALLAFVNSL